MLIEFRNVFKIYGEADAEVRALDGVNLEIADGEFVAVMGPSGSGKSTCMNILGCLDAPTSGTYLFRGVDVGQLSRNERALLRRYYLGFVFQGFNLLKRTTAIENVELLSSTGQSLARKEESKLTCLAVGGTHWKGIAHFCRTIRWSAAESGHRQGASDPTCGDPRRRADGKSRFGAEPRNHGTAVN
jgi:putative ABC transport system ATP-binding protein